MRFMVVGINHETAPVEVRERVSISDAEVGEVLRTLRNSRTVLESVVLSTCNRTEVYVVVSSERAGTDYLRGLLARFAGASPVDLGPYVYVKTGRDAVHHLFQVACGLDSMILGETQILGQVRDALCVASVAGNVGSLLNQWFRLAVQTAKQAHTETEIGTHPVSVSYAAVQLAKKIVGSLNGCRVLLLGAGKMSVLTLQHLKANGAEDVVVVNRSADRAVQVATRHGARAANWSALADELAQADVVVTSTGAREPVVEAAMVAQAQRRRGHRPLVVIDIGVPRNVDPAAGQVRQVYHFDIDDLNGVIAANIEERRRAVAEVERLVANAMASFADWLSQQSVVPVITAIRERGTEIEASVLESLRRKLPHLSDRDFSLIHKHTMSIVNQLLRDPIQNMKEQAISAGGGMRQAQAYAQLFGVDAAIHASDGAAEMMDGYRSEGAPEGLAALAAALRAWFADDEKARNDLDAEHALRLTAR